jgi:hypothetical protein
MFWRIAGHSSEQVLTLTTTTGQQKGSETLTIPQAANFSLPHIDNFDSVANDTTPKFTSDMAGVFTAVRKTPFWSHFYTKNDLLTKTGSGLT